MTWLVVGLGNPGPTYAFTRHNVGFFTVDAIADAAGASFVASRNMHADTAELRLGPSGLTAIGAGEKVVLAKPTTFMNESGRAVGKLAAFFKVQADHIVVIHDELDLDYGRMRLKKGGGDNGHNGLKSIRAHLGTGDYNRVRWGIGRPPGRQNPADYVLATIPKADREDFLAIAGQVADAVECLLTRGLAAAQNQYNS